MAKHPIAILGAADVGAPASIPIYQHANLAYLGGIPFTPVPMSNAPNSIQFWSVSVGDNAGRGRVRGQGRSASRGVAIVYFNDTQGASLLPQIMPVFKSGRSDDGEGHPAVADVAGPVSPQAALVESSGAQLAYIDVPNGCGNVLKALKSVGFTGKIMRHRPVRRAAGDRGLRRRGQRHVLRLSRSCCRPGPATTRSCSRRR